MKNIVPTEYLLIIGFIEDRIDANKDNEEITQRLKKLLNEAKALSEIDLEEYDARKHFVDDYD